MSLHTGLDTETDRGRAVLLCTPAAALEWPESLPAVLDWLTREAPRTSFLAWHADFDVQALLRLSVPREALLRLGVTSRVTVGGWALRYVPGKVFTATRAGKRVDIFDLCQFFATSLERASQEHLGEGKAVPSPAVAALVRQGTCAPILRVPAWREELIRYCMRDASLCERLGDLMGGKLIAAGLEWDRPVSGAGIARRYWRGAGVTVETVGRVLRRDRPAEAGAYRGGRFEVLRRGMLGRVSAWDIHSAYPWALADCPALSACQRIETEPALRSDATYAVALADVTVPWSHASGPVPVTGGELGRVIYPIGRFSAWIDAWTWRLAVARGCSVRPMKTVQWVQVRESRPWTSMAEMYQSRRDPAVGWALKIVLNATYGLLAEKLRRWRPARRVVPGRILSAAGRLWEAREAPGPLACRLIAAHVTGRVRYRLLLDCPPEAAYVYATDGVLLPAGARPAGPIGEGLGDWGYEGDGEALVVGSGLYSIRWDGAEEWETKSRGYRGLRDLPALLRAHPNRTTVPIEELRGASLRELCRREGLSVADLNDLRIAPRRLFLGFDTKRRWSRPRPRARDLLRGVEESMPLLLLDARLGRDMRRWIRSGSTW